MLSHNGNEAVIVGHCTVLKEQQGDIRTVMDLLKYHEHDWIICIDLKWVVNFWVSKKALVNFLALFACGRAEIVKSTGLKKDDPNVTPFKLVSNGIHNPIVSRDKMIFPSLHIKLVLIKQLVKALPLGGKCFQHCLCTFPGLSYEKIEAGVFDGLQIHTLACDQIFVQTMNGKNKTACLSFVDVMKKKKHEIIKI